jgi:PAS domain S-box-containing protein
VSHSDHLTEAELRQRLAEVEAALAALRSGKADTLLGDAGPLLFQLKAAAEERERAEAALRESESRLRAIFDAEPECLTLLARDGTILDMNPAGLRMIEAESLHQVQHQGIYPLVLEPHRAAFRQLVEHVFHGRPGTLEFEITGLKGARRWLETHATPLRDPSGRITALLSITRDITEHKQSEALLACQATVLEQIATGTPLATTLTTLLQQVEALEPGLLGSVLLLDEAGVHLRHCAAPSLPEAYTRAIDGVAIGPNAGSCGTAAFRGDAVIVEDIATDPLWKDYRELALAHGLRACWSTPILDEQRRVLGTFAMYYRQPRRPSAAHLRWIELATHLAAVAIATQRNEEALRRSEAQNAELARFNQEVLDALTAHVCVLAEDGTILAVNKAWRSFAAANPHAPANVGVGANYLAFCEAARGEDAATAREVARGLQAVARGEVPEFRLEYPCHSPGAQRWFQLRATRFEGPGRAALVVAHVDITERKQAEAALRESEARFRRLFENSLVGIYRKTPDGRILLANPALVKMLRYPSFEALAQVNLEQEGFQPQYPHRLFKEAIERDGVVRGLESAWACADGATIYVRESAQGVRGPDGRIEYYDGVVEDITEQRRLEEALRQSQKMEAIGQLAGGVAHDFNNILTVILAHAALIALQGGLPDAAREGLEGIRAAAERAANLTRQLLLFSRREVLQPRDLDLNEVVTNLANMLQRIIGEDVRLELHLHPTPLWTHADAGMLDQVLLNLAVNARDAMPDGGQLIIEATACELSAEAAAALPDATPGHYVGFRVSDTGCGIPPEILPRIFEPFFTTKEPGRGTGLGLATVFGIVHQHRGFLRVASEPGRGTTFEVFLPALTETPAAVASADSRPAPRGGSETILLVEDDSELRSLTRAMLEDHGYRVLEAPDGPAALALWRQHREAVALLLTDLVMPGGVNGRDLARRLRADRPQLKVVYTSGYSADLAGREWHPGPGETFLQKPWSVARLLETVRQCLDASAGAPSA